MIVVVMNSTPFNMTTHKNVSNIYYTGGKYIITANGEDYEYNAKNTRIMITGVAL